MKYFTPLQNLLNHSALNPNKVFLHQPINRQWHEFTWAEVEYQARCIAAGLKAKGFKGGSKVGILSKNCAYWFIVDLAIMMAGMISVPIYPTASRKTIRYVAKHADLKAIFVGKLDDTTEAEVAIDESVLRIAFPYPTISAQEMYQSWLRHYAPLAEIHFPAIDDVATIVYTSGSTGTPKGVVWSHKNWASAALCTAQIIKMTHHDRILSYMPLAHAIERSLFATALYSGCQVYFAESLDTFIDDLQYAKPTAFGSVPRLWKIFQSQVLTKISQKKLDLLLPIPFIGRLVAKSIRGKLGLQCTTRFCSGSAPIPLSLLKWYEKIGIEISEAWGMTETSSMSCVNLPYVKESLGTIGKPLPCVEMKISDDEELLVRGDAVFSEYYLQPDKTKEAFIDGWFKTGDCAEVSGGNTYKIIGRIKDNFKTAKGKYVTPVPIESQLSTNTDISQVCVMGAGRKQPVALVVLNETRVRKEVENNLHQTLQTVNNQLEDHQKLDYLLICKDSWSIDNDLMTPTMKIRRHLVEQKYQKMVAQEHDKDIVWEVDISGIS